MKITAQEEYGLRCLLHLARIPPGETLKAPVIAEREGLSSAHVEKLLHTLNRAGLTTSVRGAQGGYRLARAPQQVTLRDAIEALGGVVNTADICGSQRTGDRECVHQGGCGIKPVWGLIGRYLSHVFESITLYDLAEGRLPEHLDTLPRGRHNIRFHAAASTDTAG